jgi:uncharacterized protein (DUF1330 family)
MPTQPTPEQLAALAAHAPEGPLSMLNLLKFRARAQYEDGRETDLTGEQAYMLYGAGVAKLIVRMGGSFTFMGKTNVLLIGDGDLDWDTAAVVEYPSLRHFQDMTASEEYAQVHVHRDAGLAHQLLINCLTQGQSPRD